MLTIDQVLSAAAAAGCPLSYRTLRYYSSLNLIATAKMQKDQDGRVRGFYPASTVDRLAIIDRLQRQGLNLQQINQALNFALAGGEPDTESAALREWRQSLMEQPGLPLLYDLLPVIGEGLRQQLVELLQSAGIPPNSSALRDARLTMTARSGQVVSRVCYLAEELLSFCQLNFWELPLLAELLAALPGTELPRTLSQVRSWLHGRTDWNLRQFWLSRYDQRLVGCCGLQQPWPLQLAGDALLFGPVVQPEFSGLCIEPGLLRTAIREAKALALRRLLWISAESCPPPSHWQQQWRPSGQLLRYTLAAVPEADSAETEVVSLATCPSGSQLAELFPTAPLAARQQATGDATSPGWALLAADGQAVACIWLNLPDRQLWLASSSADQPGLSRLLQAALVEAHRRQLGQVSLWLPESSSLTLPGQPEAWSVYSLELQQPGH